MPCPTVAAYSYAYSVLVQSDRELLVLGGIPKLSAFPSFGQDVGIQ